MKISLIFFSLLSGLSVALLALLPLIPQAKIGRSFFVSICVLCLCLVVPFLAFLPLENYAPYFPASVTGLFMVFSVATALLLALFYRKGAQNVNTVVYAATIGIGLLALLFETMAYLQRTPNLWWTHILVPLNFFSSAFLLGATLFAMLLGHWYLVQFDLDKKLLKKVCTIYCVALALRIITIALGLWLFNRAPAGAASMSSLVSFYGHGIFFWMRLSVGIFLPLILAYMIYETAKMGANQSCTGLLYVAVLFVFMGEMVSHYVYFLKGIPI